MLERIARQESFQAGELSPSLHSSWSIGAYAKGLRLCRNWIVTKYGTLLNRAGTKDIGATKTPAKKSRLVTFDFSDNQAYALEFGDKYIRFWKDQVQVQQPSVILAGAVTGPNTSRAWKSTDWGDNWTNISANMPNSTRVVDWAVSDKMVVGIGFNTTGPCAVRSSDGGATWASVNLDTGLTVALGKIRYGGGRWVVVLYYSANDKRIWISDDAINWREPTVKPAALFTYQGLDYDGRKFVTIGVPNAAPPSFGVSYSFDGDVWSPVHAGIADNSQVPRDLHFTGVRWVACGKISGASQGAWWSDDPTVPNSFVVATGITATNQMLHRIRSDGNRIVTVGDAGACFTSDDGGKTYTSRTVTGAAHQLSDVRFVKDEWFAVGVEKLSRSADNAVTWTTAAIGAPGDVLNSIGFAPFSGVVLEVATPYLEGDLAKLKVIQSGDTLTISNKNYLTKDLVRFAEWDWRLANAFSEPPTDSVTGLAFDGALDQTGDATHPPKEWDWVVSPVDLDGIEGPPCTPLTPGGSGKVVLYTDKPVAIKWNKLPDKKGYIVFRGRNDLMGYVEFVPQPTDPTATEVKYKDDGNTPVPNQNPRLYDRTHEAVGHWPDVLAYFEDRLVQSGSLFDPSKLKFSATADYENFDIFPLRTEDKAFERTLASRKFEEVRGFLELDALLTFTSQTVWSVSGAQGYPISYRSVSAKQVIHAGCSAEVSPLDVGDEALFAHSSGGQVRNVYKGPQGWTSDDVSLLVGHLFENRKVVSWGYARRPYEIVWVILDNGDLLSLTYSRKLDVWAWACHKTSTDLFESVAIVPEGNIDAPYFIVNRAGSRRIEVMQRRDNITNVSDFCGLDAAVRYSGAPTTNITGLTHLNGREVYALADGVPRGPFTVSGGAITLPVPASLVWAGLRVVAQAEALDYPQGRTLMKAVARVFLETSAKTLPLDSAARIWFGEDFNTLTERDFSAADGLLEQIITRTWNPGARCAVELRDPVPVEIRGLTREIELGQ